MGDPDQTPRGDERYEIKLKVRISTIDSELDSSSGRKYFRTSDETSANLSRRGAFVLTPDPVAPGRRVLVEMDLPEGPRIEAIGRVAWSKIAMGPTGTLDESGIGVHFVDGAPEHLRALEEYLAHTARELQKKRAASKKPVGRGAKSRRPRSARPASRSRAKSSRA